MARKRHTIAWLSVQCRHCPGLRRGLIDFTKAKIAKSVGNWVCRLRKAHCIAGLSVPDCDRVVVGLGCLCRMYRMD